MTRLRSASRRSKVDAQDAVDVDSTVDVHCEMLLQCNDHIRSFNCFFIHNMQFFIFIKILLTTVSVYCTVFATILIWAINFKMVTCETCIFWLISENWCKFIQTKTIYIAPRINSH